MTDEERFRNAVVYGTSHPKMYMTQEQADIERLRKKIGELRAALVQAQQWIHDDDTGAYNFPVEWGEVTKVIHVALRSSQGLLDNSNRAAAALKETGDE